MMIAGLLLVCTESAAAQYRVSDPSVGGYFKVVLEGVSVRGDNGLVAGLGFGFVLKQKTFIGLGGYGLFSSNITTSTLDIPTSDRARLYLVWGGLEFEHLMVHADPFRFGVTSLLGVGNVEVEERLFARVVQEVQDQGREPAQKSSKDSFYLFDPGVLFVFTPQSWMQLSARVAYRIPFGVSYLTMNNSDIGGFIWGVRVSVGSF
jgi:hypothetical protein